MYSTAIAYGAVIAALHIIGYLSFKWLRWEVKGRRKKITIVNRIVCSCHATVMTACSVYYWMNTETSFWIAQDNVYIFPGVTPYQSFVIQLMLGYLVSDTVVEAVYGKGWMTLAHHISGIISHMVTLVETDGSAATYSMMVYLAECSTPFLHTSWILKEINQGESALFKACVLATVLCFFVFRILLSPYLLLHVLRHWLPQGLAYVYVMNVFLIVVFIGLNYYWFYLIIKVIPIPGLPNSKKKRKKTTIDNKAE